MAEQEEHLGKKLYRQVWSRAGGRPWTYLARDGMKTHALAWLMGALSLGILLGHIFWNTSLEDDEKYETRGEAKND